MQQVIQVNQKVWLKLYIDMNTKLSIEAKNDFEEYFFKLMNNAVLEKENYGKGKKAQIY